METRVHLLMNKNCLSQQTVKKWEIENNVLLYHDGDSRDDPKRLPLNRCNTEYDNDKFLQEIADLSVIKLLSNQYNFYMVYDEGTSFINSYLPPITEELLRIKAIRPALNFTEVMSFEYASLYLPLGKTLLLSVMGNKDGKFYDLLENKEGSCTQLSINDFIVKAINSTDSINELKEVDGYEGYLYTLFLITKVSENCSKYQTLSYYMITKLACAKSELAEKGLVAQQRMHEFVDKFSNVLNFKSVTLKLRIKSLQDLDNGVHVYNFAEQCVTSKRDLVSARKYEEFRKNRHKIERYYRKLYKREEVKTRAEVTCQLSNLHLMSMEEQESNFNKLLTQVQQYYKSRINQIEDFYVKKMDANKKIGSPSIVAVLNISDDNQEDIKSLQNENEQLKLDKINIEYQLCASENKWAHTKKMILSNIDELIKHNYSGQKLINPNKIIELKLLSLRDVIKNDGFPTENTEQNITTDEILPNPSNGQSIELKKLLDDALKEIVVQKLSLAKEKSENEFLKRKLKLAQYYNYHNTPDEDLSENLNTLTEENTKLKEDLKNMVTRHQEQFTRYERMIQKSREEVKMYKREAELVRQQFLLSHVSLTTPPNYRTATTPHNTPSMFYRRTPISTPVQNLDATPQNTPDNLMETPRKLRSGRKLPE